MKNFLLSILGVFLLAFSSSSQVMSIKIRVVFPFDVSNVILKQYHPASTYPPMNNTGTNEYSYESLTDSFGQFVFNISYHAPQYFGTDSLYLTGFTGTNSNARPAGIIYGKLYVNNTLLNSIYTTLNQTADGLNVSLRILPDSSVIPLIDALHPHTIIDDRIPPEVAHRYFYKNAFPSNDHHNLTAWVQVLTDNNCIDTCQVDVDSLKLYGRKSNILTLLFEDDYSTFNPYEDGGLFLRYPFFPQGDYHEHPFPCTLNGGIMTFYPTNNIKRVWHWWTSQPIIVNDINYYDSYRVECKMRIKGHALAQVGLDFRINPYDNPYELGTGNWVFEKPDVWQDVIFDSQDNSVSIDNIRQDSFHCYFDPTLHKVIYKFNLDNKSDISIKLFSIDGKEIESLEKINISAGQHSFQSNYLLLPVQSVIYKVSLQNKTYSGKILIY